MTQPWEGYRSDNGLRFSPSEYFIRLCGEGLTAEVVAARWQSRYRARFHEAIWREHHDELSPLQARGVDLIATARPNIGRGDLMNRLILFVSTDGERTPAQIVHEEMEPVILGPYIELNRH